ncbi:MAG: ABC transporter substrate-binding protein [Ferruginibacter sp.]|nr:ABC transporter substrate-binding protein [Cytophagales bacterium]
MRAVLPLFRYFLFATLLFACSVSSRRETAEVSVRVRLAADPESLNPVNYGPTIGAFQMVNLLFQSLLMVDLADNQYKPLLVGSLPLVERQDSLTRFTYTLRPEAKWDNGRSVTVQDVIFSMKVIQCPLVNNEAWRPRYEFIRDIRPDSTNPRRFTIVGRGYTPDMLFDTGDFFILPAYLFDPKGLLTPFTLPQLMNQFDQLSSHPNVRAFAALFNDEPFARDRTLLRGSGGYALEEWKTGYLRLTKKPGWWAAPLRISHLTAHPPALSFRIIPDVTTALVLLKNRQLDVLAEIPAGEFVRLRKDATIRQNYALFTPQTFKVTFIGLNGRLPKLAHRKTRQALAHLVDVNAVIQATQRGFAIPTVGLVSPKDLNYYNRAIRPRRYDVAEAERLLREAGWQRRDGRWVKQAEEEEISLTLTLCYRTGDPAHENTALIFQRAAAQLGIPVTVQPMENQLLFQSLKSHQFEACIRQLSGPPFVPNLKPYYHSESAQENGRNHTGFGTAESDSLIEVIGQAPDVARKAGPLKRLQAIMHEESNLIFLYFSQERLAIHRRFTNVKASGVKPFYDVGAFTLQTP